MHIAFFGSSLLSSYWNGAATYYRGIIAALAKQGWRTTFYEPDAFDRQKHRDIDPPDWARSVIYPASIDAVREVCTQAARAEVVVKASGIGVFDDEIVATLLDVVPSSKVRLFWDVDAPATLAAMSADARHPLRAVLPQFDAVLTYGGGMPVVEAYERFGARLCVPIYNALDPSTHYRVGTDSRFAADLAFLGNRLPDRETRVQTFFFAVARMLPQKHFLIGGAGWEAWQLPTNVHYVGHVSTRDHNAFNSTPLAVLNVTRDSMATNGFSPATRVFEAAGAAACLISDAWQGIEQFLEPGKEILLARHTADVARHVVSLTSRRAREIGDAALARVLREHTYAERALRVSQVMQALIEGKGRRAVA